MKTIKSIFYLIGILCITAVLIMTTLFCIPTIREKVADKLLPFSPKHQAVLDDLEKQKQEIDDLNEQIKTKDALIAENTSLINQKDAQILAQQNALSEKNQSITTLSSQKIKLLSAVTQIDNLINSTVDQTEIDNLEEKKTAILKQIDSLNESITTLNAEKTQLEQDIATLTQEKATLQAEVSQLKAEKAQLEHQIADLQAQLKTLQDSKGISLLTTKSSYWIYNSNYDFNFSAPLKNSQEEFLQESYRVLHNNLMSNYWYCAKGSEIQSFINSVQNYEGFCLVESTNLHYNVDLGDFHWGHVENVQNQLDATKFSKISVLINNEQGTIKDNVKYCLYFSKVDADNGELVLNLITLTGKFFSTSGNYIDFDLMQISINNTLYNFTINNIMPDHIELNSDYNSYMSFTINQWDNSLTYDDNNVTYAKQSSSTDQTTTYTYQLFTDKLQITTPINIEVNFNSNGKDFTKLVYENGKIDDTSRLYFDDTAYWNSDTGFESTEYSLITFEAEPTGELLDWLTSNGFTRVN